MVAQRKGSAQHTVRQRLGEDYQILFADWAQLDVVGSFGGGALDC